MQYVDIAKALHSKEKPGQKMKDKPDKEKRKKEFKGEGLDI